MTNKTIHVHTLVHQCTDQRRPVIGEVLRDDSTDEQTVEWSLNIVSHNTTIHFCPYCGIGLPRVMTCEIQVVG